MVSRFRRGVPAWFPTVALGAVCAGFAVVIWLIMGLIRGPQFNLGLIMAHWFLAGAIQTSWSQRLIGRGQLDNRVVLRLALGYTAFLIALNPTQLNFLLPVGTALAAAKHLQWSGSRTWRPAAALTVVFSVVAQVLPRPPFVHGSMPQGLSHLAALASLTVALGMIATIASLTAQREKDAVLLAVEQSRRESDLHHAATHDALTGLLNRSGISSRIEHARQEASPGRGVGVLYMDLDGFKAVNDTQGHATGDELLQAVAERLSAVVRPGDDLARMGGDEFVALLRDLPGAEPLHEVARRADEAIAAPFSLGSATALISVSIGIAFSDQPAPSMDALLHEADAAMYEEKRRRHTGQATHSLPTAASATEPAPA